MLRPIVSTCPTIVGLSIVFDATHVNRCIRCSFEFSSMHDYFAPQILAQSAVRETAIFLDNAVVLFSH